jgi:signal transduction histidine kinase
MPINMPSNPGGSPSEDRLREAGVAGRESERGMSFLLRALGWLDRFSPVTACMIAAVLIVGIGIISYLSGPQLSSSLFYLIPVLLVSRVAGFRPGILAALFSAMVWLLADLNAGLVYGHAVTPYWNAVMRLGSFLVAVCLVAAMGSLNAHLEQRVHERTAALEAQIVENRELERNILEISDREQARIGQDLHDGLCQQLVSAAFTTNMLREKLDLDFMAGTRDAGRIADMIDEAIDQARNLARGLYPVRLETEGLEMALRELASSLERRFQSVCTVECPEPLPPCRAAVGIHFYRIAQEALVNAAKHSRAQRIVASLDIRDGRVRLSVEDNGVGISRGLPNPGGMGLRIMEYRARMIGADFQIASAGPRGTRVSCEMDEVGFEV